MNIYKPGSSRVSQISPGSGEQGNSATSDLSRMLPRQISTGTMRGTQNVGSGNAKIDSSNNRITIGTPDGGSVGMGQIPGTTTNEFGFFTVNANGKVTYKVIDGVQYFYDNNGNLIQKVQAGTTYVYNPADSYKNVTQSGLLPDGSGGFVVAKTGQDVSSAYS